MNFKILKASSEHSGLFSNLMQFYYYDFSEFLKFDVEQDGFFPPSPNLDDYWKNEQTHFSYLIQNGDKHIGFVLVRHIIDETTDYFSIAEFFILRKYRRAHIGEAVAIEIFKLHKGRWGVSQKESNEPAQLFWRNTINKYTGGNFKERKENDRIIQNFENHSSPINI